MNVEDMYVGQRVRVSREAGEHVGWVPEMDEYLGTVCTVRDIVKRDRGGEYHVVILEENSWVWNPDSFDPCVDLKPVSLDEFNALLAGGDC